jgi:predicted DsbA family dithiol-disulfide isomerase
MKIRIFSDLACPWCYLGKRRLDQALDAFPQKKSVEVEWMSFQLDSEMPDVNALTTLEHLVRNKRIPQPRAEEMIKQTTQVAAADDLELRFDRLKLFNTRNAHRLLHYAKELGRQGEMKERLFRAAFTEGQELGKTPVLAALAGEIGLDPAAAFEMLNSDRYQQAVLDDEREAQALRVNVVPYFVFDGKHTLSGAQSVDLFIRMLEKAWAFNH